MYILGRYLIPIENFFSLQIPTTNGHLPTVLKADDNWVTKLSPLLKTKKTEPVVLLRYGVELADLQVMMSKQKKYSNIRYANCDQNATDLLPGYIWCTHNFIYPE